MFYRDDIPSNDRLSAPILVTVRGVEHPAGDKVDSIVMVEDNAGHQIPLKIWTTHNLTLYWNRGHQYELRGVRGSHWGGNQYELHSTQDFSAEDCGSPSTHETRLFVIGDSHIGYENRTNSGMPRWARNISTIGAFEDAMAKAESLDVDAVVHTGDIFDHVVSNRDLESFRDTLIYDRRGSLPFYYIYGNHDPKPARAYLRTLDNQYSHIQKLTCEPASVGDPVVNLLGVDHLRSQFHDVSLTSTLQTQLSPTVLVIHETPHPATNSRTSRTYTNDGVNLELALTESSVEPDLIVCGHMHIADKTNLDALDIPVVVTGPTVPISKVEKKMPSGWIVTVSESGLEVAQQLL